MIVVIVIVNSNSNHVGESIGYVGLLGFVAFTWRPMGLIKHL